MIIIESMAQLEALIEKAEQSQDKPVNNFYLYEDDAARLIGQRRLYCQVVGTSFAVYSDEGAYYQMYFFADKQKPVGACHTEKPLVCEVLFREGDKEGILKMKEMLNEFSIHKTSAMVTCRVKDIEQSLRCQYDEAKHAAAEKQIFVRNAAEKDLPALKGLWSYLDPLDFKYMNTQELEASFINKEITVAESGAAGICGTVWRTKKGHTSLHKQLAVSETMRGHGIGRLLVLDSLMRDIAEGAAVRSCWLDIKNNATLSLHNRIGFVSANKLSVQLTL